MFSVEDDFINMRIWKYVPGLQPPELVPAIGKRVVRAWLSRSGRLFAIQLEGDRLVQVTPAEPVEGFPVAIAVKTGVIKPGHAPSMTKALDAAMPVTDPRIHELEGSVLEGLDANVVAFKVFTADRSIGLRFTPHGVEWVRQSEA